ncbi:SIS domain-containing protein [Streptomyces sp. NPDC052225]|uniref:SIS domain-containing protein n=1 Tax=Streptomyces sp. NPDC052225 TaxID=3154949 RepID=UPI003441CF47
MSSTEFSRHVAQAPSAVEELVGNGPAAGDIPALDPDRPLVLTGIGTSLHACRVAATWIRRLSGGRLRPAALDAHDLALTESLTSRDQVVVVSHRGTKRYPNEVLRAAREAGATTVCVTGRGSALPEATTVLRTCEQERASTHSVSYLASLAVLGRLAAAFVGPERSGELTAALRAAPDAMRRTLDLDVAPRAVDALVHSAPHPVLVAGGGLDAITADEAALKIKEGTYRWTEGLHTEFALHGTPAVFSSSTVGCLIRPTASDGGRTDDLAGYLGALGAPVLISGSDPGTDLPFAPVPELARPFVTVLPFLRLVAAAAGELGASPDLTHLEAEPWATAAKAVRL